MFTYHATIVRIVDGDTLVLQFDLGFHIYHVNRVRLRGVDCPERGTPEGSAATAFVKQWCQVGTMCIVSTTKDKTDKYGRYVADVELPGIGNLSAFIIERGHGKEYV